jgi:dTDP-glucose 4,6-dehydratase
VIPVEDCSQVGHVDQIWHFSAQTGSSGVASTGEIVGADVGFTSLLLEVAARQATPPRFLYTSSGAVYGRSRPSPVLLTETSPVAVFESSQPYDLAKGASELLLRAATIDGQINSRIARLFAFVGPRLPLHAHFAIGNFIADAAAGKVVVVRSGGVDRRSWMYAGDMANVLIGMAFGDSPQVLNVGGGEAMSIAAAAERVANIAGVEFVVQGDLAAAPTYYVPEISLLESTFPEANWTTFDDSVIRTINWARTQTAVGNLY